MIYNIEKCLVYIFAYLLSIFVQELGIKYVELHVGLINSMIDLHKKLKKKKKEKKKRERRDEQETEV